MNWMPATSTRPTGRPGWRGKTKYCAKSTPTCAKKSSPANGFRRTATSKAARVSPARFAHNWNRSYTLLPQGQPVGAVVLLHGLSDSPYSLRHIARIYADHGFAAIGLRLPGHGTVPAGLTSARWQDWLAATRLAVREARRLAGARQAPAHRRLFQRRCAGRAVHAGCGRGLRARHARSRGAASHP